MSSFNCKCVDEVDAKLAERNTRLTRAFCFTKPHERLMICTEVVEKKRGAKACGVFPTYCPFCGVLIEPAKALDTLPEGTVLNSAGA